MLQQIEVMHDYQGNRSCLYGPSPETDSEVEDNPEQVTRYVTSHLSHLTSDFKLLNVKDATVDYDPELFL